MLRNALKGNQMSTSTRIRWAGLTGRERNGVDGASFVLLHGLTFDRRMWGPILDALPEHTGRSRSTFRVTEAPLPWAGPD